MTPWFEAGEDCQPCTRATRLGEDVNVSGVYGLIEASTAALTGFGSKSPPGVVHRTSG
jgi:hypothetical protein